MSKRMFSSDIVESDAFLDMPLTAQALYLHLSMSADNDGFVNPKRIVRMTGAANDDLQILIAKRFLLQFPSGVVVIKHWWINNTKRHDRHVPTTYQTLLQELQQKPNKSYTFLTTNLPLEIEVDNHTETNWQPTGNQRLPQYNAIQGNTRHVQYNADELPAVSKPTSRPDRIDTNEITELLEYWKQKTGMEIGNETGNRRAVAALIRQRGIKTVKAMVDGVAVSLDDQYAPRISDFVSLKRKQNDLLVWGRKRGNNAKRPSVGVV